MEEEEGTNWKGKTSGRSRSRGESTGGREIRRRKDTTYLQTSGSQGIEELHCEFKKKRMALAKNTERG